VPGTTGVACIGAWAEALADIVVISCVDVDGSRFEKAVALDSALGDRCQTECLRSRSRMLGGLMPASQCSRDG
jgi:hypothetical protein